MSNEPLVPLTIQVSPAEKSEMQRRARADGRKVSQWARRVLQGAITLPVEVPPVGHPWHDPLPAPASQPAHPDLAPPGPNAGVSGE